MEHDAHVRVIVSNLKGTCCEHNARRDANAGILGAAPTDGKGLRKVVAEMPRKFPDLPFSMHLKERGGANARRRYSPACQSPISLRVSQIRNPSIQTVKIVRESKDPPSKI